MSMNIYEALRESHLIVSAVNLPQPYQPRGFTDPIRVKFH